MSDSEHSTVTYTSVPFPVKDDSDIGSPGIDGPPIMPEDPYAYIMAAYEVPGEILIETHELPMKEPCRLLQTYKGWKTKQKR
ncbi:hypothetical protein Tco_1053213 [Tanacetum coccineum]